MKIFLVAAALLCLFALNEMQPGGKVLTTSDIQDPHLMRRPVVVEGKSWLGLYLVEDGSRVDRVQVEWIATVEFGDSIFTLSVQPKTPILIVADVPQVSPGPARTLIRYEQTLSPGSPLTFSLGPQEYEVQLRGTTPGMCDATVTLSDGTTSQELYFPDEAFVSCDEPHFSLQWAGDLDGDGLLDLAATFSPKYSYYPRRLFLSSAASEGMLVGLVAVFDGTSA